MLKTSEDFLLRHFRVIATLVFQTGHQSGKLVLVRKTRPEIFGFPPDRSTGLLVARPAHGGKDIAEWMHQENAVCASPDCTLIVPLIYTIR